MEQTYAFSAWFFTRALSLVYLIAFLSLLFQAKGLWGAHGVMPMTPFLKAVEQGMDANRYWQVPSVFWLSSSDDMIVGVAMTGVVAAFAALMGFAQGWSLLMCFTMYLSFCSAGQEFMSFQWDSLLLEVGLLSLFMVPWNFDFSLNVAAEPHWLVRAMFYVLLFKLMFLSGVVKLISGDESWRDLSALSYHYWTQPLPNPLSPFMHALPLWVHQVSTALTFVIELVLPFFMFWPRARVFVALGFCSLSLMIFMTGNYTFFNLLTIALCIWLVPDGVWQRAVEFLPFSLQTVPAAMFPHPLVATAMGMLAAVSLIWCVRFWLPDAVMGIAKPVLQVAQIFHISNPYGLFANMTKTRPEIIIEGSNDGKEWKEYEFRFKPGNLYRSPPIVAPYQPRLDWQMWFAALGPAQNTPWVQTLMLRLFENSADVLEFFSLNPFPDKPPQYLRAQLYNYEFTTPGEIFENGKWWTRSLLGPYTPVFTNPSNVPGS